MKNLRKILLWAGRFILIGASLLIVLSFTPLGMFIAIPIDIYKSNREVRQLLYKTDHQELLVACREVMKNRRTYHVNTSRHKAEDSQETYINPANEKLPEIIRKLEPRDIYVTETKIILELHGGFAHYGIFAVPKELEEDEDARHHGSGPIKLIDGLWYYDDGLVENYAYRVKKLKRLKPRNVPEPEWWSRM